VCVRVCGANVCIQMFGETCSLTAESACPLVFFFFSSLCHLAHPTPHHCAQTEEIEELHIRQARTNVYATLVAFTGLLCNIIAEELCFDTKVGTDRCARQVVAWCFCNARVCVCVCVCVCV
jgi:hypothetical protein